MQLELVGTGGTGTQAGILTALVFEGDLGAFDRVLPADGHGAVVGGCVAAALELDRPCAVDRATERGRVDRRLVRPAQSARGQRH